MNIVTTEKKIKWSKYYNIKSQCEWKDICLYETLSEEFIREFQDKVEWLLISVRQTLSEDFIREFQDKVEWVNLTRYQKLSEDFIREFKDKVCWSIFKMYNYKFSKKFEKEFAAKLK